MRNKGKVFFGVLGLAFALIAIAGAKPAEAAVPGWARTFHGTRVDVFTCGLEAQSAIQEISGGTATRTRIDNFSYEIHWDFTGNVGIFAYCTASQLTICPNRPRPTSSFSRSALRDPGTPPPSATRSTAHSATLDSSTATTNKESRHSLPPIAAGSSARRGAHLSLPDLTRSPHRSVTRPFLANQDKCAKLVLLARRSAAPLGCEPCSRTHLQFGGR